MSEITGGNDTSASVAFALAWTGPCTSTWTAADGTVTHQDLGVGQELREFEVTATTTNDALGQYLEYEAAVDQGNDPTVDAIFQAAGI